MDSIKLKEMNYEELRDLIEAAKDEMMMRRNRMQEEAWEVVKQAIYKYTHNFGDIIIDNFEYNISDTCDLSTVGSIITYDEEEEKEEW